MLDYDECLTIGIKLNLYGQARDEFGIYVAINSWKFRSPFIVLQRMRGIGALLNW